MITVFLGDFHYKYDGHTGTITNILNGNTVLLSHTEVTKCNKSNSYINDNIIRHSDHLGEGYHPTFGTICPMDK